ncbi:MAG: single-stranded DNA-binding protein [Bacteroidia bacterium]|jgi:single-strand DNA-binding protein|uniref:Single-stranded DNA-binding protein n=1 Tax=bioreactor metagenome TaxID=1076179 RepID=A0A644Y581_9ZZZZ|nr:single-stranded DNA-binding protein [Rikenellaceae bacterium]NCB18124.1 single-stranded DNA-binding protein [Bacteroidia bacterium]
MSLNKVMLIGNVGREPEVRDLSDNTRVARFSLATTEKFRSKKTGELVEQTEWHNIVCWQSLANLAADYIKKGSKLYIEGRIKSDTWMDKTTQEKRESIEILATSIILLDKAGNRQPRETPTPEAIINETIADKSDIDDLPF